MTYKLGKQTADSTTEPSDFDDVPKQILNRYGRTCFEEKFNVLPYNVRARIAHTVDGWVKANEENRFCVADTLVGSLTFMAHGTHQIYCSFDRFLDCNFSDSKLLKLLRCYKNCVPEPGTYFGEIVAQFFQHCKQQSNLNVKRTTGADNTDASGKQQDDCRVKTIFSLLDTALSAPNDADTISGTRKDGERSGAFFAAKKQKADIDGKYEVIMSLKRAVTVVLMFRCVQHARLVSNAQQDLIDYLKNKVFGTLLTPTGDNILDHLSHEFNIKQFENEPTGEIYFSLTLYRNVKNDAVLDNIFNRVDIYNKSVYNGVKHRLGVCTLVYCSDTLYFMGMSQTLFIDNSVTFLYCFLSEKYRPVVETKQDSFVFGLVKILASIEYFTECSLKRNCNGKMGHGPLTSVISEGGLNESVKYVNNIVRNSIVYDQTRDTAKEETSTTTLVDDDNNGGSKGNAHTTTVDIDNNSVSGAQDEKARLKRYYVINEPYINTFLNKPVECGNMY